MLSRINFILLFVFIAAPAFAEFPGGISQLSNPGMSQPMGMPSYGGIQPGYSQMPGYGQQNFGMPQYGQPMMGGQMYGNHGMPGIDGGQQNCGQQRPVCGGQQRHGRRSHHHRHARGCGGQQQGFSSFSLALSFGGGGSMF